jgi:hypothetical protein
MKRAAALLLAAVLCFCLAGAEEEKAELYWRQYVICRPESFLYVRMFPRKSAEEIGRLEMGEEVVTKGEKRGKYMRIYLERLEGGEGWVHAGYLVREAPEVPAEGEEIYVVAANGRVAARRYVNGSRRAWLKPGRRVKVYAMTAEWALTSQGFIRTGFLKRAEE